MLAAVKPLNLELEFPARFKLILQA